MAGNADPWVVTPMELERHKEQFRTLNPINGFVTGEQAKVFLLQSQLPPPVLGLIWSLADADSDGKMNIYEFSVACKLINLKLRGFEVPRSLPPQLKAIVAGTPTQAPMSMIGSVPPPVVPMMSTAAAPRMMVPGMIQSSMAGGGIMAPSVSVMPNMSVTGMVPPTSMQQPYAAPLMPQSSMIPQGSIMGPTPMSQQGLVMATQLPIIPGSMVAPLVQSSVQMAPSNLPLTSGFSNGPMATAVSAIPGTSTPPFDPRGQRSASVASMESGGSLGSPLCEWAVPHQSKLKYTQLFNSQDRNKSGFISGAQARNILVQTQVPQAVLAQIWGLSDLDNDGRLGCEEFILALHLCDVAKSGDKVPTSLPPDLIPPTFRRTRQDSIKSLTSPPQGHIVQQLPPTSTTSPTAQELIDEQFRVTFEDKRKENFDKGQAELERRRKALLDSQRQERDERERKEREEHDKRERIRLDQERRRQEELERQLHRQREVEQQKEEERKKAHEQRESARKEMERQRQLELEKQRRDELVVAQQKEQERVLALKSKNQSLSVELGQMNEKVRDLSQNISETRTGVSAIKSTIDSMRSSRDGKLQEMSALKNKLKEQNQRLLTLAQEKARMEAKTKANSSGSGSPTDLQIISNKQIAIKQLKDKLKDIQENMEQKKQDIENNNSQLGELKQSLTNLVNDCQKIYIMYEEKRNKIIEMRGIRNDTSWSNLNASWDSAPAPEDDTWNEEEAVEGMIRYRALYEFVSRKEDELSFQPGDIIQVPIDQTCEPGWLGGTLRGHTGWFPEAYVEKMVEINGSGEVLSEVQMKRPLEGIAELPESDNGSLTEAALQMSSAESPIIGQGDIVADINTIGEAIFPLQGRGDRYISFNKGDIIRVKEIQSIWCYGELNGVDGWFPKSYVKLTTVEEAPTVGEAYIALYPYQSAEPGDLMFEQGETIYVIKHDGDWWTGTIGTQTGIFPSNYVQKPAEEPKPAPAKERIVSTSSEPQEEDLQWNPNIPQDAEEAELKELAEKVPKSPKGRGKKPEIASVIAPYQSTSTEQLSLQRGQLIMIRKKTNSGWWEGELQARGRKKQVGWFPASYVKVLAPGSSNRSTPVPIEMREGSQASSPTQGERVVVLYPYTAQNEDELSLAKGDVVNLVSKDEPEWWKGELNGTIGMFPSNYVEILPPQKFSTPSERVSLLDISPAEKKRQDLIYELIATEETYVEDMSAINNAFCKPLQNAGICTEDELECIFANSKEIIDCNQKLLRALRVRRKMSAEYGGQIHMIGDILCENLVRMTPYIRFCSRQLSGAALLQHKSETCPNFLSVMKEYQRSSTSKGMPLSSFLIKPMQRITKYPLLIKKAIDVYRIDFPFLCIIFIICIPAL